MVTVDAHHHFWQVARQPQPWRTGDHEAIARDFEPAHLTGQLAAAGVEATVLVQSVDLPEENARMLRYAAQAPYVRGIVAWAPLHDPDLARHHLDPLYGQPLVRGVRSLVGRDDADWLTAPETLAVFKDLAARGLTWDVVPVTAAQTAHVLAVAEAVPGLRIVVDHLARPPLDAPGTDAWQPWADRIRALSEHPNVAVKLSVGIDVLTHWPRWSADDLLRCTARALEGFDPGRAMLASNWPVVTLRRSYAGAWRDMEHAARTALGGDEPALAQVRGGTAAHWYALPEPAGP